MHKKIELRLSPKAQLAFEYLIRDGNYARVIFSLEQVVEKELIKSKTFISKEYKLIEQVKKTGIPIDRPFFTQAE